MLVIGLLMFLGGFTKSEFIVYKLLRARATHMWGENADKFLMIAGLIIALLSSLFFIGIWG